MAKRKPRPVNYTPLTARRDCIERALDELTTVELSGHVEDLAPLSGVLNSYLFSPIPAELRAKLYRIDGVMLVAMATCLDMVEKDWVTPAGVNWVRAYLERALSLIILLTQ